MLSHYFIYILLTFQGVQSAQTAPLSDIQSNLTAARAELSEVNTKLKKHGICLSDSSETYDSSCSSSVQNDSITVNLSLLATEMADHVQTLTNLAMYLFPA